MKKLLSFAILVLTFYNADAQIKISQLAASSGNADSVWVLVVDNDTTKKKRGYQFKPAYPGAGIPVSTGSAWTTSITNSSTDWNTAYTDRNKWDGGATGLTAATGRTSLGGTTVGQNLFTLANPSAVRYLRINADNTVSTRTLDEQRVDLNAAIQGGSTRVKWHIGNGNGTGVVTVGWTITAVGTATAVNVATTNRHTQSPGIEYLVTVASTTAIAGWRETQTQNFLGNTSGSGGFIFICRFGPATGVSTTTNRCFTGMGSSAAAPTDVNPSTILNQIGAGWDDGDVNIQFMSNDGSGSATKIDLGIPVPTVDRTSLYELKMVAQPNSSTITYTFTDLASGGSTVTGSTSTDMPAANTLLAAKGWMSVGGTSSVIGYKLSSVWVESNF